MKTSLKKSTEEEKRNKEKEYNYSGGVTKKLLEKYMPSKTLTVIRGGKEKTNENKAA